MEDGNAAYKEHITGDETLSVQQSILDLELKTAFCMPIKDESGVQGVIYADSKSGTVELDQGDRALLGLDAQIDHCRHCMTGFGGNPHHLTSKSVGLAPGLLGLKARPL